MFEWEETYGADRYELAVYQHSMKDGRPVQQRVVNVKTKGIAWLVTQGLSFGQGYHWQVKAFKKQQIVAESPSYVFDISTSPRVMNDSFRAEVSHWGKLGQGIVFLDRSAMAICKMGKPVWFLPMPNDSVDQWMVRDLELTPQGTISYIDGRGAYEKDLMGNLLWQAPDNGEVSGGNREEYHHEMRKDKDGSYWLAGSAYEVGGKGQQAAQGVRYNTILRYDAQGGLLWSWDERNSLRQDTFFARKSQSVQGSHLNGFALAQGGEQLFMSFKNLSDVLLYDLALGRFVASLQHPGDAGTAGFRQQHGPFLTAKREILIYNNNISEKADGEADTAVHPSAMVFRQYPPGRRYRLVWEYPVRSPRYPQGIKGKEGYVSETAAGTLLICPGGVNYAIEVGRNKQKRWEGYFYRRSGRDTAWKPYSNYRCQSATSLYPHYVTLQYVGIGQGQALFRLQNLGSESGHFELLFSGTGSPPIRAWSAGPLRPGASQVIRVPINFCKNGDFSCTITHQSIKALPKTYFYKKMQQSAMASANLSTDVKYLKSGTQ
jgi:hypothetical protein